MQPVSKLHIKITLKSIVVGLTIVFFAFISTFDKNNCFFTILSVHRKHPQATPQRYDANLYNTYNKCLNAFFIKYWSPHFDVLIDCSEIHSSLEEHDAKRPK